MKNKRFRVKNNWEIVKLINKKNLLLFFWNFFLHHQVGKSIIESKNNTSGSSRTYTNRRIWGATQSICHLMQRIIKAYYLFVIWTPITPLLGVQIKFKEDVQKGYSCQNRRCKRMEINKAMANGVGILVNWSRRMRLVVCHQQGKTCPRKSFQLKLD